MIRTRQVPEGAECISEMYFSTLFLNCIFELIRGRELPGAPKRAGVGAKLTRVLIAANSSGSQPSFSATLQLLIPLILFSTKRKIHGGLIS